MHERLVRNGHRAGWHAVSVADDRRLLDRRRPERRLHELHGERRDDGDVRQVLDVGDVAERPASAARVVTARWGSPCSRTARSSRLGARRSRTSTRRPTSTTGRTLSEHRDRDADRRGRRSPSCSPSRSTCKMDYVQPDRMGADGGIVQTGTGGTGGTIGSTDGGATGAGGSTTTALRQLRLHVGTAGNSGTYGAAGTSGGTVGGGGDATAGAAGSGAGRWRERRHRGHHRSGCWRDPRVDGGAGSTGGKSSGWLRRRRPTVSTRAHTIVVAARGLRGRRLGIIGRARRRRRG